MTKFKMLYEIAKDCMKDDFKARQFAFMSKEHKSLQEVKNLYAEWKSGAKNKEYFQAEIIGYTESKKKRFYNNHKGE